MANAMVNTVKPKARATPSTPIPEAANTALPQPPNTSQNVPNNSVVERLSKDIRFLDETVVMIGYASSSITTGSSPEPDLSTAERGDKSSDKKTPASWTVAVLAVVGGEYVVAVWAKWILDRFFQKGLGVALTLLFKPAPCGEGIYPRWAAQQPQ
jgi:hypothetical protein